MGIVGVVLAVVLAFIPLQFAMPNTADTAACGSLVGSDAARTGSGLIGDGDAQAQAYAEAYLVGATREPEDVAAYAEGVVIPGMLAMCAERERAQLATVGLVGLATVVAVAVWPVGRRRPVAVA